MHVLTIILAVDPNLGRVDCHSLSDQTLLEMLYEGLSESTKRCFQSMDGTYFEVCTWEGVTCDDDERVVEIGKCASLLIDCPYSTSPSLELRYIPPKVRSINFMWSKLTGSADLTSLPKHMEKIDLKFNELSGSVELTQLPQTMEFLELLSNKFTGTVGLRHLPEGMKYLSIGGNRLSGSVHLDHLPIALEEICLQGNSFTGSFIATNLPKNLRELAAEGNTFHAIAVADSQSKARISLADSGVTSVVDENGNEKVEGVSLTSFFSFKK